ncbi:Mur ligase family protein [Nocardiopsis sp. NPDC101807]|uniref:Mur ligase family protein n=1 Tax=Nocardiopsis sp. NPDC101807 TaxID=3364339 RepID=UPI00381F2940
MSLARIAAATGGRITGADPATPVGGIAFDPGEVRVGDLFISLREEGRDGHGSLLCALEAGAAAVLTAHPVGAPAIVVGDPLLALGSWARAHVEELPDLDVIAITGSSGRTATRDLLSRVLESIGPTVATRGRCDDETGLPLTALEADAGTRYLVAGMSARGPGHITYLTQVTPPTAGVVLDVGTAREGGSGGPDPIAKAAVELVEALPSARDGGVAVLNADDPGAAALADRTTARVVTFGTARGADVRAVDVAPDERGRASFTLRTRAGDSAVCLQAAGGHQVVNALAAAAAAGAVGMDVLQVGEMLSTAVGEGE